VTDEGRAALRLSRARLGTLRDGDWREVRQPVAAEAAAAGAAGATGEVEDHFDDLRAEGTPAYLPPEVLRGRTAPGFHSDCWAIGCIAVR